jgi:hypothetical protein
MNYICALCRLSNELHWKNKQTPRNNPTQLTDHLSHTQMAWFGFSRKTNTKFEQRNSDQSDQGGRAKENTSSNEQFLSSTLKNGFTAEHFSVCSMHGAELRS